VGSDDDDDDCEMLADVLRVLLRRCRRCCERRFNSPMSKRLDCVALTSIPASCGPVSAMAHKALPSTLRVENELCSSARPCSSSHSHTCSTLQQATVLGAGALLELPPSALGEPSRALCLLLIFSGFVMAVVVVAV